MKRSERKAYNQGKREGYKDGYVKGLYDGNPFNKIVDALVEMANTITANPELMAEIIRSKTAEEWDAELAAEDLEDKEIQDAMRKTYLEG